MLDWIRQNNDILSVIASFGTLLVWIFYAQLLFNGYRRERRPRILINKGVGTAHLDAPCLICNMSREPIFIQCIWVTLETADGTFSAAATDADEGEVSASNTSVKRRSRQGPLDSGSVIEIPTFRSLLQKAADAGEIKLIDGRPEDPDLHFLSLTITVISIYGPEDKPFGATRSFELNYDEPVGVKLRPMSLDTSRLSSRREKERMKKWLKNDA